MSSALLVRFRPAGPWRLGSDNGVRVHAGSVLHSDTLYSAITLAMRDCGWLDEWIAATAGSRTPAVRISSGYPFSGSTLLVQPPRTVWPPAQGGKLRWKTARFVPLTLVPRLLAGEVLSDDQWAVDPVSECLLPVFKNSVGTAPFRIVQRVLAPVDRVSGATEAVDRVACLQFAQGAGIWFIAAFTDDEARSAWSGRMRSIARLLADTGIGGGRSRGWGRSREPQFGNVDLPEFFTGGATAGEGEAAWWLLSLYSPAEDDRVDWDRGVYSVIVRAGRTENGDLKPASRMVAEGSVVLSGSPPAGTARNVAPAEVSHPVYRSGIALAVPVPYFEKQRWELVEHAPAAVPVPGGEAEVPTAPVIEEPGAPAVVDEIPVGVDTAGVIADVAAEEFASADGGTAAVPGEDLDATAFEPVADTAGDVVVEEPALDDEAPAAPTEAELAAKEFASTGEDFDARAFEQVADTAGDVVVEEPAAVEVAAAGPSEAEMAETVPADLSFVPDLDMSTPVEELPSEREPTPATEEPPIEPEAATEESEGVSGVPGLDRVEAEPATSEELASAETGPATPPGEDPAAAGVEPAADFPEEAGTPKPDEEEQA